MEIYNNRSKKGQKSENLGISYRPCLLADIFNLFKNQFFLNKKK